MESLRKPFEGVSNIVKFNWHFYVISIVLCLFIYFVGLWFNFPVLSTVIIILIGLGVFISLLVSYYVYDVSNLYSLDWLKEKEVTKPTSILNIHAGFDEISAIIQFKYPTSKLKVVDFYNPQKHTEVSIERARKSAPAYPQTKQVETTNMPFEDESYDIIFVFLSAHEIRNKSERILFLKELKRGLKDNGEIHVTEHLRDLPNFLAFNFGFFHFHSRKTWLSDFESADLAISSQIKITPFLSTFKLKKNGNLS